jgi:hypothetical protein
MTDFGHKQRHHLNSIPIFLVLNKQDWIPKKVKARLIEWKIRMDLAQYAARRCPPISMDKISAYQPKNDNGSSPSGASPGPPSSTVSASLP